MRIPPADKLKTQKPLLFRGDITYMSRRILGMPSGCSVGVFRRHDPTTCFVGMRSVGMVDRHASLAWFVGVVRRHVPSACSVDVLDGLHTC